MDLLARTTRPIGLAIAGLLDLLTWQLLDYWTYWPGNCWTTGPIGLAITGLLDLLAWQLLDYWTYIGPGIAGLLDLVLCMRLLISDLICFQVLFQRRLMGGVVQHSLQTVLDFLKNYKLDKYSATFQEKGMDGDLLLKADNRVLRELGVTSAVDCKKIRTKYKTFIE